MIQTDDNKRWTESGRLVWTLPTYPTFPVVGARVEVERGSRSLGSALEGKAGKLLGYTVPHGFALVDFDGLGERMVHPEALRRLPVLA